MSLAGQCGKTLVQSGIFLYRVQTMHDRHRITPIRHHHMFTIFYLAQVIGQTVLQFSNANGLHLCTPIPVMQPCNVAIVAA